MRLVATVLYRGALLLFAIKALYIYLSSLFLNPAHYPSRASSNAISSWQPSLISFPPYTYLNLSPFLVPLILNIHQNQTYQTASPCLHTHTNIHTQPTDHNT